MKKIALACSLLIICGAGSFAGAATKTAAKDTAKTAKVLKVKKSKKTVKTVKKADTAKVVKK